MVVLLSKSKFASPTSVRFRSYEAAACFAEKHSFPLYLLRNKSLPQLSVEHLKEENSAHKPEEPEESKCHSCLQKGQAGGPRELQAGQPHLSSWEGDRAHNPGKHFQEHEGQAGRQE